MIKFEDFLKEQIEINEKKMKPSHIDSVIFRYAKNYSKAYKEVFSSVKNATGNDKEILADLLTMLEWFNANRRGPLFEILGTEERADDVINELLYENKKIKTNGKIKFRGEDIEFKNLYNEVAKNFIRYESFSRSDQMRDIIKSPEKMHYFNKEMLKLHDYFEKNMELAAKNTEYKGITEEVAMIYSLFDSLKDKNLEKTHVFFVNGEREKMLKEKKLFLGNLKQKLTSAEKIIFINNGVRADVEIKTSEGKDVASTNLAYILLAIGHYYMEKVIYKI